MRYHFTDNHMAVIKKKRQTIVKVSKNVGKLELHIACGNEKWLFNTTKQFKNRGFYFLVPTVY